MHTNWEMSRRVIVRLFPLESCFFQDILRLYAIKRVFAGMTFVSYQPPGSDIGIFPLIFLPYEFFQVT